MECFIRKHINTECLCLGITIDWNVHLGLEKDLLFWVIDITFIKNFRKGRNRHPVGSKMHRHSSKGE